MTPEQPPVSPSDRRRRTPRPPVDAAGLKALALGYAARYATSRARLAAYLNRKLAERGWDGDGEPPVDAVVGACADLGYVDDEAFAEARIRALGARGFGRRRIRAALSGAGIDGALAAELLDRDAGDDPDARALAAARDFARRRRLGPWRGRPLPADLRERRRVEDREMAALARAGHGYATARAALAATPDD